VKKIFFFIFVLILLSGCALSRDVVALKSEVNQIKSDVYNIGKETTLTKKEVSASVKEETFQSLRESGASLRSEVSGLSKDVQTLTGRFDEYKNFIDTSLKKQASETDLLKSQIAALETQIKDLQAKVYPKQDADKTKDKTDSKTTDSKAGEIKEPGKLYESAYNAFKAKKYKESRQKFEAFLKEYPKDSLASNAQFWVAETYYAEEDYAGAVVEYDALLKKYPNSEKASSALLKQGYAFIEMGDKKAAKGILEQLKTKYPKSKEAEQAKKKLDELNKKKPAKSR
jgi:tol-pal system protein YbgF